MNPDQYDAARLELGLTLSQAELFHHVTDVSIWRWRNNKAKIPHDTAKLLAVMIAWGISPDEVLKIHQDYLNGLSTRRTIVPVKALETPSTPESSSEQTAPAETGGIRLTGGFRRP